MELAGRVVPVVLHNSHQIPLEIPVVPAWMGRLVDLRNLGRSVLVEARADRDVGMCHKAAQLAQDQPHNPVVRDSTVLHFNRCPLMIGRDWVLDSQVVNGLPMPTAS